MSYWHDVTLNTHLRDYSKAVLGLEDDTPTQPGPSYTARAMTMAHLALYDGLVGITGEGRTYMEYAQDAQSEFSGAEFSGVVQHVKTNFPVTGAMGPKPRYAGHGL